MIEILEEKAY